MIDYKKPEVMLLGEAVHVIENRAGKATPVLLETPTWRRMSPAYDLDE